MDKVAILSLKLTWWPFWNTLSLPPTIKLKEAQEMLQLYSGACRSGIGLTYSRAACGFGGGGALQGALVFQCLLCAKPHARHLLCTNSFYSYKSSVAWVFFIPFYWWKLRLRKFKWLAQDHRVNRRQESHLCIPIQIPKVLDMSRLYSRQY